MGVCFFSAVGKYCFFALRANEAPFYIEQGDKI